MPAPRPKPAPVSTESPKTAMPPEPDETTEPQPPGDSSGYGESVPMEAAEGGALPELRPRAPFLLFWQPGVGCFTVRALSDGTAVLVPRIQRLDGMSGANGVSNERGLDFSRPVREIQKRGGIVLNAASLKRHGLPTYMRRTRIAGDDSHGMPRYYYHPPWLFPLRNRSGRWDMGCDEDMKTRWEESLLTVGVIPMPESGDLEEILGRRYKRIDRHINRKDPNDALAHDQETAALARELAAIKRAGLTVDDFDPTAKYRPPETVDTPATPEPKENFNA